MFKVSCRLVYGSLSLLELLDVSSHQASEAMKAYLEWCCLLCRSVARLNAHVLVYQIHISLTWLHPSQEDKSALKLRLVEESHSLGIISGESLFNRRNCNIL